MSLFARQQAPAPMTVPWPRAAGLCGKRCAPRPAMPTGR